MRKEQERWGDVNNNKDHINFSPWHCILLYCVVFSNIILYDLECFVLYIKLHCRLNAVKFIMSYFHL